MVIRHLAISALVLSLVGCAAGIKHSSLENKQYLTTQPAKSISIALNNEAKAKVADNLKFNQSMLLAHVKRALLAKDLLNETQPTATNTVEILVKDFRVRSNFSAVMFGFMAGNDNITGDVILKDPLVKN